MKSIARVTWLAALAMSLGVGAGSVASAKGHDQGFGAGIAGQDTAGLVDDGQANRDGNGPETTYGLSDAVLEAKDGVPGKSVSAQNKDSNHPSVKSSGGR